MPRRTGRRMRPGPDELSAGEYATLVIVVAAGLVATVMFVTWVMQQRGLVEPGTVPGTGKASTNGDGLDYVDELPHGARHL